MTDRELLQQALDALKHLCLHSAAIKGYDGEQVQTAIDALRARLSTCDRCGKVNPAELHTCTPPQREWQALTDEETFNLWMKCPAETEDRFAFARAFEAKLKEKNT